MSRRNAAEKRVPEPDPIYASQLVNRFINRMMAERQEEHRPTSLLRIALDSERASKGRSNGSLQQSC